MAMRFLCAALALLFCVCAGTSHAALIVKVVYPDDKLGQQRLFLRGSLLGLNWDAGRLLTKSGANTWQLSLNYTASQQGQTIEMKPLIEDRTWMIGANFKVLLPAVTGRDVATTIYPWFTTSSGTLVYEQNVQSPQLNNRRNIAVYLPPSYYENYLKPYDQVLVMHDGNNVFSSACSGCCPFGCWNAHTTLNRMIYNGQINEVFVIGVYNTADRIAEYTYSADPGYGGGKGDLYLDFLEDTVVPYMAGRYRITPKPGQIGILGSSLGGLISCYAGWSRSNYWGRAGCMSSSFWWNNEDFNRVIIPRFQNPLPSTSLYIDVGGVNDGRAETETVRDTLTRIGKDFDYLFDPDGSHSEASWASRFDSPMLALYPLAFSDVQ